MADRHRSLPGAVPDFRPARLQAVNLLNKHIGHPSKVSTALTATAMPGHPENCQNRLPTVGHPGQGLKHQYLPAMVPVASRPDPGTTAGVRSMAVPPITTPTPADPDNRQLTNVTTPEHAPHRIGASGAAGPQAGHIGAPTVARATTTTTTNITGSDGGGGDGDDGGDGSGLVSDPSFPDRIVEPVLQAVMDGDLAALRTALDGKSIDPDVRPYLMCS